jgi:integrase
MEGAVIGTGKLTATKVRALKEPGRYGDGAGLMLVIGSDGSRKWVLRLQADGRRRDFGLGSAADVTLANARSEAERLRQMVRAGLDPVAERNRVADPVPTFSEAARRVHAEHRPTWKNAKHAAQWLTTLEAYAFPHFGDVSVADVTGPMVRNALADIWLTLPETARRVRQRIGAVLDWAHAKGYRSSEAPRAMLTAGRGLPRQPKNRGHFAALGWKAVPAFLQALDRTPHAGEGTKLAVRFLILTAARSGEVRGALWSEIDHEARVWSIPGERMKAGRPHTVPLSNAAMAVLERAALMRMSDDADALVFPGERRGRPLSDMTLTMALRRMKADCTVHGFRSSFRDWAAEATNFPREVAEAALAHVLADKVEAAYRRSDLLEKRRKLMEAWAGFCTGANGKVISLSRTGSA